MKGVLAATAAAVVVLGCAVRAQAADPEKGLYLRGDTGWSMSQDAGKDVNDDVGGSAIISGGVGYRLNQHIRGDVTLGYRGGYEVDKSSTIGGSRYDFKGDVSSLVGMANVYVDIAKIKMFTPYVGGGIGFARNKVDDVDVTVGGSKGKLSGDDSSDLAWQLSAGVGIDVAPQWMVDVGYRYMDLGEAKSGTAVSGIGGTASVPAQAGELKAHELQVGVRYNF